MKIGMVLPTGFPPDIRVEKEVLALMDEHELWLLCPRRGDQPKQDTWHGLNIRRALGRLERWWSQWTLMALCDSGVWESEIVEFAGSTGIDVLHVHDLPLLGPAWRAANTLGIPIVADLHENYPAMLAQAQAVPLGDVTSLGALMTRLSVSVRRWQTYEARIVPQMDRVIVVVDEARDRLKALGVDDKNLRVVGNYATLDPEEDTSVDATASDNDNRALSIVYAGGFGSTRDLPTVLRAIAVVPDAIRESVHVTLVGGRGRELDHLQQLAKDLGVDSAVTLLSWMPRRDAEALMSRADIGLVPHVKSAHTDATVPHKLFQYMWRRLPVIVSDCAPLERIVRDAECGLVYPHGDAEALARCFVEIHERDDLEALGDAGRDAVLRKYSWPRAADELLELYRGIT